MQHSLARIEGVLTADFFYDLPSELIAHAPLEPRDQSRLLRVHTDTGQLSHHIFSELPNLLRPNDVLVFNDTQVIKARLFATRKTGGKIEIFLLKPLSDGYWNALLNPARRLKLEEVLEIAPGFSCRIIEKLSVGFKVIFESEEPFFDALEQHGHLPLPPYIHAQAEAFQKQYQTLLAKNKGAVAAPTAGLHFTESLLETLKQTGIQIETITLHVGYGTFQPMASVHVEDHNIHSEYYEVTPETALALNQAHREGRRIIAIGTTSARTLETIFKEGGFHAQKGETSLFIYPGYTFKAIQGLLTNFHLPQSTLLVLISALAGKTLIEKAYQEAILQRYRFYSFGDAMLILP